METIYSFEYDIGKEVIIYRTILYSMSPKHTKNYKKLNAIEISVARRFDRKHWCVIGFYRARLQNIVTHRFGLKAQSIPQILVYKNNFIRAIGRFAPKHNKSFADALGA